MRSRTTLRAVLVAALSVPAGVALPAPAAAGRYWSTADVCMPHGGPVTYVPAPGADPLTVPACQSPDQAAPPVSPVVEPERIPAPWAARPAERERSARRGAMERERSARRGAMERERSERRGAMERERSERRGAMERERSERRARMGR